jgi:hypothetical protein
VGRFKDVVYAAEDSEEEFELLKEHVESPRYKFLLGL